MSDNRYQPQHPRPAVATGVAPLRNRRDRHTLRPADHIDPRYADISDRRLAITLSQEDFDEDHDRDPMERITCRTHRRWLHQCVSSPLHVIIVTGHRWCRSCSQTLTVVVDELAGDVSFSCPGCGEAPPSRATRQLIRACRASLAAAHDDGLAYPGLSTPEP